MQKNITVLIKFPLRVWFELNTTIIDLQTKTKEEDLFTMTNMNTNGKTIMAHRQIKYIKPNGFHGKFIQKTNKQTNKRTFIQH